MCAGVYWRIYNLFSATDVVKGSAVGKTSFFDCKLESTKNRERGKVKACLVSISHLFTAIFKVVHYWLHLYFSLHGCSQKTLQIKNYLKLPQTVLNSIYLLFSPLVCNECKRFPMEINGERLTGREGGRWRSAVLYLSLALCSNSTKAVDKYWHSCVAIQERMQNLCTVDDEAREVVLVRLKGLVRRVRGPFRLLFSQTKLWWRSSLQQDMAAGGEKAAAALQTYSPAGAGYLSHLVCSPGCPLPSTPATTNYRESYIWPYLSMCAAVYQCALPETEKNFSQRA